MKFKLLSAVILTALSATAFSATEQTFSDGLKIKLNEKSTGSDLRMYKGKPVLAIADLDKNKISHNYFDEFNVGKEGMYIGNNKGANTIITEVISNSPSLLNGNIDIIGKLDTLVVANPNGITTDSGFSVSNIQNLELATAKITDTSDKDNIKMINSKDGKLRIIRTDITPDAKLDKLSLISNKISIKKSKLNSDELNFNLLTSSKSKKTLSDTVVYVDAYGRDGMHKIKKTNLNRKPSELYISADSEVTANNVNINLLESKFNNKGSIHGRENVRITSKKQNEGNYTTVNNGDIITMNNMGTIWGKNITMVAHDRSHMENNGEIIAMKNMDITLDGSTFVNNRNVHNYGSYGNKKTTITFDQGSFINNGEMKSDNLLITNTSNGKYINNGSLDFKYYDLTDFREHDADLYPMNPFQFINNEKSNNSDHDTM
ncbi:TPA: filamentous hemagglutinin N-terminal domain-containing protein [Morganella morganii]|nr:filamentous hemagglutinin N-terminal domain-containing protein [Morganella morganii]